MSGFDNNPNPDKWELYEQDWLEMQFIELNDGEEDLPWVS